MAQYYKTIDFLPLDSDVLGDWASKPCVIYRCPYCKDIKSMITSSCWACMADREENNIKLEEVKVNNLIRFMVAAKRGEFDVLMTALLGEFTLGLLPRGLSANELVENFVKSQATKSSTHAAKKQRTE